MNFLINLFKDSKFVAALGLIVVITLVIVLGAIFKVPWLIRIIIIVVVILLFLIFFFYKKMKDAQKAGQIEQSISAGDSGSLSPEKRTEIEQFKKQLEAAITSLKNSKLGKGKIGKSALYALPWYMIIGPSAAGKTTAIQNSGLEFPYGKDVIKGVGGTRNCDWFFSTKAIFLDTAGRYVSQTEDRAEWVAFLETLKKNRKKKPINGVIVALNIDEIINSDNNNLYEHAKNIRARIDELIEQLKIVFPVYLVFTKCDLIQGFVEYFGDFSEIERSQIWGSTLNSVQQLDPNPKSVFEKEFTKLSDLIYKVRTIRLSNPLKREQRRKVFLFPYQFKSLQEKLTYFVGEIFQPNPYQDNPIFRGFYFTSGTQEGLPLDVAIKEIAKKFNLPSISSDEEQEILETKNYFIKDLMNEIVIPDQNFSTGQATSVVRQNKKLRLATVSFSVILLLLLGLFTFIGFGGSSNALDKISQTSESFSKINWSGDLLSNLTITNDFIKVAAQVESDEAIESFTSFGLDRSDETYVSMKELFRKKTGQFFRQNIFDWITRTLGNYSAGQDFPGDQIYNYLKSYLLLTEEQSRLDTTSQKFLSNVFKSILDKKLIEISPVTSAAVKDSLRELMNNYCSFTAKLIVSDKSFTQQSDSYLIGVVRNKFQIKPSSESIYARIKEYGRSQYPAEITLTQAIGGSYTQVITTDYNIPYLFTRDGWDLFFKKAILEESQNPGKEDWVLGKRQSNQTSLNNFDPEKIKRDLFELYLNDYKQNWIWFLQSIKFPGFGSVPLAANSLKIFSDPVNSPFTLIFKLFADETKFIVDFQQSTDSGKSGSFSQAALGSAAIFDIKRMRRFILGSEDGSTPAELNAVIAQYGLISGTVETFKGGSDLSKDYAVNVLNQRAVELPTALQVIRGSVFNTPEFQNMIILPIQLTWSAILNDAVQYINLQWKVKVVDMFNRGLAESFPFNSNGADAPLQDFSDFFRPETGILWSFFNDELSAFINKDRWKTNLWDNQGIDVSNDLINTLKKANEITSVMFKGGEIGISFKVKPQLPVSKTVGAKKPTVVQIYFSLDGVEETYKMGSAFWTEFNWPGSSGIPGARLNITLSEFGTSETKSFDGEWAFFRLLNSATSSRAETSSQYIYNWSFKSPNLYDVIVTYTFGASSSRNPFAVNFFKSFKLPSKIN